MSRQDWEFSCLDCKNKFYVSATREMLLTYIQSAYCPKCGGKASPGKFLEILFPIELYLKIEKAAQEKNQSIENIILETMKREFK
jgi:NAD-dependent SIR2 family protein deacetylase